MVQLWCCCNYGVVATMVLLQLWCCCNYGVVATMVLLQLWCCCNYGVVATMLLLQLWCCCNYGVVATVILLQLWYCCNCDFVATMVLLQLWWCCNYIVNALVACGALSAQLLVAEVSNMTWNWKYFCSDVKLPSNPVLENVGRAGLKPSRGGPVTFCFRIFHCLKYTILV